MKFFVDTAEIDEIRELNALGLVDGVTTNPSLIKKSGRDFIEVIREICGEVEGPVSAETVALDYEGMMAEGREAGAARAEHRGEGAADLGRAQGLPHAVARRGGWSTSRSASRRTRRCWRRRRGRPSSRRSSGRLDDINIDGMDLIRDIRTIYDNYGYETEILAASIRSVNHVKQAALIGADVITAPASVLHKLAEHPLTDKGLTAFLKDWSATGPEDRLTNKTVRQKRA